MQPAADLSLLQVSTVPALELLEGEWQKLWAGCPWATPFQSPAWLLPWLRHIYRGGELLVLAFRRRGSLVGLAPLFAWGALEHRQVNFLGDDLSDYVDILAEPDCSEAVAAEVLAYVGREPRRWCASDLRGLRPVSPLLATPIPAGIHARRMPGEICPVVELPASPEQFAATLPARFRKDLERTSRQLQHAGPVMFEVAGEATLSDFLDALIRLHGARWHRRGETGMLSTAALESFHREVARAFLACGVLRLDGLRFQGRLAAILYGFAHRACFYMYLTGFEPALARFSPGSHVIEFAIQQAIAEGLRQFDFLSQGERYKYAWGAQDRQKYRLVFKPSRLKKDALRKSAPALPG